MQDAEAWGDEAQAAEAWGDETQAAEAWGDEMRVIVCGHCFSMAVRRGELVCLKLLTRSLRTVHHILEVMVPSSSATSRLARGWCTPRCHGDTTLIQRPSPSG